MKLFHLSDLHLGRRLHKRELLSDQEELLAQITEYAKRENPDAVLIAGDVYDAASPLPAAVALFDRFIRDLREAAPGAPILVISGNHDNGTRLSVYRDVLARNGLHISGRIPRASGEHLDKVTIRDEHGEIHFYLMPYVQPLSVRSLFLEEEGEDKSRTYEQAIGDLLARERIDPDARNVLVSHQFYVPGGREAADTAERTESERAVVGNIDAVGTDVLAPFDYVALGHLHRASSVGDDRIRYCGTPFAYSRSEAGQEKSFLMVELGEKGDLDVTSLPLTPSHNVRVLEGRYHDLLAQPTEDYVFVQLTDTAEVAALERNSELRRAFPNMLTLSMNDRNNPDTEAWSEDFDFQEKSELEICGEFLGEGVSDEQMRIITEILEELHTAQEEA